MFRLAYLPKLYKQEGNTPGTYFVIIGLDHTVGPDGWKTNITGQIVIDNENFYADGTNERIEDEDKLRTALEESFEDIWQPEIDEATKEPDKKPEPQPYKPIQQNLNPNPIPPKDRSLPPGQGGQYFNAVKDENGHYRIGDTSLFKYNDYDEFMDADNNLDTDTSIFDQNFNGRTSRWLPMNSATQDNLWIGEYNSDAGDD